ncbi:T9SS type A sorting domain-containing protein [Flavobacterium soyangense]|uniref:T9SS type A sorting domain-containing protein n=1 Tax=Flavobacterium soyangense TaxID=2023265 RepID=A0A930XZF0_9FLAO|nr:T9SS type A sorting domain-containing protein [Flavobacterium soyangense]MBF2708813.1 T9SS type A sorting domain-containing protein [Flavobacterium soyangense]
MKKILLSILLVSSFVVNAQLWTEKATGFTNPNRTLYSISIVDANVIWAQEFDNINFDSTIKGFTLSTDGGKTWTAGPIDLNVLKPDDLGISSITAVSATTAWISVYPIIADTSEGGIWKTTDSGATWTKQTTTQFSNLIDSYANFVHFWDANNGIAGGDPEGGEFEIYTTTDGGTNWTRVDGANIPDPDAGGEYGYENIYTVSGNTIWFGTDTGRLFKSDDKGLTWTVNTVPTPSIDFALDRFTFSDANKGLLMTYDPVELFNTTDGGATWSPVTKTGNLFNTNISYIPGTSTVFSAASANPLGSSYSLDNGFTWITIDGVSHGELAFLNDSFGFSAGKNTDATTGGIFKFTGIPLKTPSFDLKNQISAYPNPTNGILHLDSEISLIKGATVFDLLGRQVYSSKFSNLNKADLDLKSLQTGNYVLKVTYDSGKTESMKVMKN